VIDLRHIGHEDNKSPY